MLFTRLEETLAERGLLRIVTFRKYFLSLVKTSRTSSGKNAADLSNLLSLCTEETFEEKKEIMFLNNLILLQLYRLWAKCSGHFAVFFCRLVTFRFWISRTSSEKVFFFLKLVLYICFNSDETFRIFGRLLNSSNFGIPLHDGAKVFFEIFFSKKCYRTLSETKSSAWPKNN